MLLLLAGGKREGDLEPLGNCLTLLTVVLPMFGFPALLEGARWTTVLVREQGKYLRSVLLGV